MHDQQVQVTFQPSGRKVFVLPGTTMLEAAARAGLTIETPCGGAGICGKCRVQIIEGACEVTPAETDMIDSDDLASGWRLACQTRICGPTVAAVPDTSLFASQQRIVVTGHSEGDAELMPGVRKRYVELDKPTLADSDGDMERLSRNIGPVKAGLAVLRKIGKVMRDEDFKGTAVIADHRLIDFEPGDTTAQCYGVAVDVGTTTLAAVLLDLCSGKELAATSRMNPQVSFGDDVLSRIEHASQSPRRLADLRDCITRAAAEMIDDLCQQASVTRNYIYEIAFAGNTTMEHLLCGLEVVSLGTVPFAPAHQRGLMLSASDLGAPVHPGAAAYVFPVIGGFVGGDAVAGMLSTRLAEADGPSLMIDIGTNGEIVLAANDRLWAASTAAGPAFEGARISSGMRATTGAIEKVVFNDDIQLSVIGNGPPAGICGSGLVDLAAGLLDAGIVTEQGRLLPETELPATLSDALRTRVRVGDNGQGKFVLSSTRCNEVAITQRGIRELQLATGAIRAGVNILLRQAGLQADQLRRVLIAGGFGSFIRRSPAQRIGLLPAGINHELIRYVGNTALSGARWALLSTSARRQAEKLAEMTCHVQLSEDAEFHNEFAEAMIFPTQQTSQP